MTHRTIKTKYCRTLLAQELLGLKKATASLEISYMDKWFMGVRDGLETAIHRIDLRMRMGEIIINTRD